MSVSLNPSSTFASPQTVCQCPKTAFEKNTDAYGPVVASAIGVAQAVADGASATVSLSEKAIGKLADSVHEAGDAVEHTYDAVKDTASSVYDDVADTASNVYDAVGSVGSKLATYASIGAQAVKDFV